MINYLAESLVPEIEVVRKRPSSKRGGESRNERSATALLSQFWSGGSGG
ncbi:MAG: hypothetical protein ACE5OP_02370 [Candidatus Glassbacteria bacterium]